MRNEWIISITELYKKHPVLRSSVDIKLHDVKNAAEAMDGRERHCRLLHRYYPLISHKYISFLQQLEFRAPVLCINFIRTKLRNDRLFFA